MTSRQHHAEERIAHLERLAEDLSDEIARQSRQIAALERRLTVLMQRAADRETDAPPADQRPPHW